MQLVVTDVACSVVCVSVCCVQMAEPIEMMFTEEAELWVQGTVY